jgi:hypothetical protein
MECISKFSSEENSHHIYCMRELCSKVLVTDLQDMTQNDRFDDREVCKDTFLFLHDIGEKHFKHFVKHMKINGITAQTHGNTKKIPHNALTFEQIKVCDAVHLSIF